MNDALSRNAERLRQNRTTRAAKMLADVKKSQGSSSTSPGTLTAGAKVFDPITGQEGEVIHAARENVVIPTSE